MSKDTPNQPGDGTVPPEPPANENAAAPAEDASPGDAEGPAPCAPAPEVEVEVEVEVDPALAEARAEAADLKDRLLRAMAEIENLRRRTEREMADLRKFAVVEFARDMLSIADNLHRAIDAVSAEAADNAEVKQLLEGVRLTEKELLHQFEKHGIVRLDPIGEKLDPNLHQAVVQLDDAQAEAGTVVQVMQPGYTIRDRLLRPAMVGVAKGGGDAAGDGERGNGRGQTVDTEA